MSRQSFFIDHIGQTCHTPLLLDVDHAEGLYIYTKDGKRYIDLIAGVSVSNIGHRHPEVVRAIKNQVDRHLHVMVYGEYVQDSQLELAELLLSVYPDNIDNTYFVNSGAEANEGALKLAKRVTGRHKIVSFRGAYHGSTHGALSVSGNETKKSVFRPLLPDVHFIRFDETSDLDAIDDKTACVIIEPIQGDAGVRIPSTEYMQALRKKCTEVGALLICDEIQTGFGRTARFFAFEHFQIRPDIITMAKGLGGGMPIGAFAASKKHMHQFRENPPLGHITTFGGHPVSCAAAAANINVLKGIGMEKIEEKGRKIEELLEHPLVSEIRRKGMFFAIQMDSAEIVQKVVEGCKNRGLISFWFLSCPDSFRIAPPLNITHDEILESCAIIRSSMDDAQN